MAKEKLLLLHSTRFYLLTLFIGTNFGVSGEDFRLFQGVPNVPQSFLINRTCPNAHKFVTNIGDLSRANLRVETSVLSTSLRSDEEDCPIIFSVRQARSVKSWALPLQLENSSDNSTKTILVFDGSHTVCVDPNSSSSHSRKFNNEFLVIASTCSDTNFNYSINFVANVSDISFVLKINKPLTHVDLSPSTTRFFRYDFGETSDRVVVQLESEDDEICMTAAVQSSWCSLVNAASNSQYFEKDGLKFQSFWQDMTKKAIIPVSKSDFPQGSFFVGFTVHSNNKRCESYNGVSANNWTPLKSIKLTPRQKTISIKITEQLPTKRYLMPILYPLFYSLGLILATLVIFLSFSRFEPTHHEVEDPPYFPPYSNGKLRGSKLNADDDREEQLTLVNNDVLQIDGQADVQTVNDNENDDDGSEIFCQRSNQMDSTSDVVVIATTSCGQVSPWKNGSRVDNDDDDGGGGPYEKNQTLNADQFHSLQNSIVISTSSSDVGGGDPPPVLDDDQNDFNFDHTKLIITLPTTTTSTMESPNLNGNDDPQVIINRTNQWLTIEAFIHKTDHQLNRTSMDKTYLVIFIVGIFYVVPTVQLLYTYHQISISTGENDLCYRNYECSKNIWGWDDFNHIYSNILYITSGLTFCLFVHAYQRKVHNLEETRRRRQRLMAESSSSSTFSNGNVGAGQYGVLNEFGVFYGLGCALILEGILSGSYHVCPTHLNFQFDTSFMYILAFLSTIKIYQKRRSCPICLHKTFGLLAFIASTSVLGLILGSKIYESVFFTLHFIGITYLAIYMYYVGHIRDTDGNAVTGSAMLGKIEFRKALFGETFSILRPRHGVRLLYVVPFIIFNVGLNIWQFRALTDFPTYLLYLFVGNMMIYFVHYLAMKVFHGEIFNVRSLQALIYLMASLVLGIWGILNFLDKRYSANLPPAKSRDMNRPCELADFYDTHDLWHFLSAGSIFYFFMTLLTIDDGILHKPRRDIVAF